MNYLDVDWNEVWEKEFSECSKHSLDPDYWENRADDFDKFFEEKVNSYSSSIIRLMRIKPTDTILDVGCGVGVMAIPLAKKAASITAVDASPKMLSNLKKRADKENIRNIKLKQCDWQKITPGVDIAQHDIVLSSGALITLDLEDMLRRLNQAAKKQVYIAWPISYRFERELYRYLGMEPKQYPGAVYVYNCLINMGIYADVIAVKKNKPYTYASIEKALEAWRGRIPNYDHQLDGRVRMFLESNMQKNGDKVEVPAEKDFKWGLITWKI